MLNRRVFFQAACRSKIKTMFFSMSLYLCGEMFFEFFLSVKTNLQIWLSSWPTKTEVVMSIIMYRLILLNFFISVNIPSHDRIP